MKRNIFGWPVFTGKIDPQKEDNESLTMVSEDGYTINFSNDLEIIMISKGNVCVSQDFEITSGVANALLIISALACRVNPEKLSNSSMSDFFMYTASMFTHSVLKNLAANLTKEVVTVNGVGFFVD